MSVAKDDRLDEALYVRVTKGDIERLETLVARIPIASRNAIARAAMRLGLELLERDPTKIIASPPSKRGPKARR